MALNLKQVVADFLRDRPEEKFTARQIAEWVFQNFPSECQDKKDRSQAINTEVELVHQLAAEIGSQRPGLQKIHPEIKTTEGRPRKYYFSQMSDSDEVATAEKPGETPVTATGVVKINEQDMYPLLSVYLLEEFCVYSKRIDEKRSSNKRGPNGNRWLYPDMVGMEDLGKEWALEVRDCANLCGDKRVKLWSFEVKLLVNRSNVREVFFQAVSNSSWANFGYLVAAEIEGTDTLKELRMLFAAHGIGLIKLDTESPSESQVLIPAHERTGIDWDTASRLTTENKDFLGYMKLVSQFHQTGEVRRGDWNIPSEAI